MDRTTSESAGAPIRAITLMYHDVLPDDRFDASGFPGPGAARYKLRVDEFERHLSAISPARAKAGVTVFDLRAGTSRSGLPVLLTFDDGGATAASQIVDRIERFGWRGHFFIPTNYLGKATFLDRAAIREIHRRGHVIGSHSASHPPRLSACTRARMLEEWRTSVAVLSDIVGERVRIASVPEGYYSPLVGETAAEAGMEALFTSEPTSRCRRDGGCLVLGRHAVQRGMSPAAVGALAAGRLLPALQQSLLWGVKEIGKQVGGEHYLKLRTLLLRRR